MKKPFKETGFYKFLIFMLFFAIFCIVKLAAIDMGK